MKKTNYPLNNPALKEQIQSGFSLIELLIVVAVIGIIASISIVRFQATVATANEASAVSAVKLIVSSESSYSGGASIGTLDDLMNARVIDTAFQDGDGDPNTAVRNHYAYKLTISGNSFVISAIPAATGVFATGTHRFGSDASGVLYRDASNLSTHYITSADLRSGTSVPFDGN